MAGNTLTLGAPPITVSDTLMSYGSSALVIGTSTISFASKVPLPAFSNALIEDQSTTTNKQVDVSQQLSHGISIPGTILSVGAPPITVSGTPIAYGPSTLAVGTSRVPLPSNSDITYPKTTIMAGQAVTIGQNTVEIAGTILIPEGPVITVSNTPVSLDSSTLVIGTSPIPLLPQPTESLTTTIAGHATTATKNVVEAADTILHAAASGATLDGTVISLDTGITSVTLTRASAGGGELDDQSGPELMTTTIAGQAITTAPGAVGFARTYLTSGAPGKLINGTLVSLNTAGQLMIDSNTVQLESHGAGSGGLIMGGSGAAEPFGSISPSPTQGNLSNGTGNGMNTRVQEFRGNAEQLNRFLSWKRMVVSMITICVLIQM